MSANNHDASSVSTQLSFRMWRRRTVEQIMSRKDLSPIARLTAYINRRALASGNALHAIVIHHARRPVGASVRSAKVGEL